MEMLIVYHLLGKTSWSTVVVNRMHQYNIFPDWKFPQGCAHSIYKTVPWNGRITERWKMTPNTKRRNGGTAENHSKS